MVRVQLPQAVMLRGGAPLELSEHCEQHLELMASLMDFE